MKRTMKKIEHIMSDAYLCAADLFEADAKRVLRRYPDRYSRLVMAVGWGPTLFDKNDDLVRDVDRQPKPVVELIAAAVAFYDRFGGDNRQINV